MFTSFLPLAFISDDGSVFPLSFLLEVSQFCGFFSNKFFCFIYFLHCHFQLHWPQLLSFSLLLLRLVISNFSFRINMYAIIFPLGTVLTASHKFWFCIFTSLCKLFNNEKLQPFFFFNITAQKYQHSNVFFISLQSVAFHHLTFRCLFFLLTVTHSDLITFWSGHSDSFKLTLWLCIDLSWYVVLKPLKRNVYSATIE